VTEVGGLIARKLSVSLGGNKMKTKIPILLWPSILTILCFLLRPAYDNYVKGHQILMSFHWWIHWAIVWFGGVFIYATIALIGGFWWYFGFSKAKKSLENRYQESLKQIAHDKSIIQCEIDKLEEEISGRNTGGLLASLAIDEEDNKNRISQPETLKKLREILAELKRQKADGDAAILELDRKRNEQQDKDMMDRIGN
jgi:hypothetical protein